LDLARAGQCFPKACQPQHVAIVGGGFSGTLLAINLMRHDGPRVTLIEREQAARGLAYSTRNGSHLLNVRASNMSAFPDMPDHFARWYAAQGGAPDGFATRQLYGRYLGELLEQTRRAHNDLEIVNDEVAGCRMDGAIHLQLASGREIESDLAVLAVGNLPPHPPPGLDPELLGDHYRSDPWSSDISARLGRGDRVLLIGTGLTAVDAALSLDDAGFAGQIVALSRRGLLPRPHGASGPGGGEPAISGLSFAKLLGRVRERTHHIGWRQSVDELRPVTQRIWQRAGAAERSRFLRHLRPWWDVHRHRLSPQVADRMAAMQRSGRLSVYAGSTLGFSVDGDHVRAIWRPRGTAAAIEDRFTRIVNCTGPGGDLLRSANPLLRGLAESGAIRPDAARLGIDVDGQCRTINAEGEAQDRLLAVGPLTRGTFWEITAVPDIRRQVWDIARRLSNAHWVEGGL
jgi:uncharacterized NAD(P)/FAD-binding protein YdhS